MPMDTSVYICLRTFTTSDTYMVHVYETETVISRQMNILRTNKFT